MAIGDSIKESDLFEPVRDFLQDLGYVVQAEVGNCDMTALKDEEFLIVELKKGLTMSLLAQAVDRQRIGDLVYMAVPKPKKLKVDNEFKKILHLVRRLELGLLFVSFSGKLPRVEVIVEAEPFNREKSKSSSDKRRGKLKTEHEARKNRTNIGGVNRKKIFTAYREKAIEAAVYLNSYGISKISDIRDAIKYDRASSVLRDNYYGWFIKEHRGHYSLTDEGRKGLEEYKDFVKNLKDY